MSSNMADTPVRPLCLTELKTLTVPKLRSLCKENGLTGYSKLTKDAIILKLAPLYNTNITSRSVFSHNQEHGSATGTSSTWQQVRAETDIVPEISSQINPTNHAIHQSRPHTASCSASDGETVKTGVLDPLQTLNNPEQPPRHSEIIVEDISKCTNIFKRDLPKDVTDNNGGKKSKMPRISTNTSPAQTSLADGLFKLPALPSRLLTAEKLDSAIGLDNTIKSAPAKPFKPLTISRNANKQVAFNDKAAALDVASDCYHSEPIQNQSSLEFPVERIVDLKQLTLPPSISKRKQAQQFAILLSGISSRDLLNCSLVSRMFRYAAHLSAYHRLRREFPGQRTENQMKQNNPNMTNMWPYLLGRQQEMSTRKKIYRESFLSKAVGEWYTLTEHLWTSPDNPKQATVAIRFILTQFYFLVSVHGTDHPAARRKHVIVECKEIVKDEIWIISVNSLSAQDKYYVLEPTCEVIGCQERAIRDTERDPMQKIIPRVDWSSYISERGYTDLRIPQVGKPLFERVKWTNQEEYDKGISKHWLKRMHENAQEDDAKIQLAQRYILACVVANSISGKWMSSVEMAQEFAGLPSNGHRISKPRNQVQLYIPEHHYVESVHLMSAKRRPLHSALAVVQTPGREYFILRDNGMQVGCEEEVIVYLDCFQNTIGMAILDDNDRELAQLWLIIQELSKQLNQNRSLSVSLISQTGDVKNQAIHSQTGFVLRRFNLDKCQEEYNEELERMNAAIMTENQSLQHDNKQLSALIKEYEQMLESIMSTFRNRARDVQERELSLIRDYETKLLELEDEISGNELRQSVASSESLRRLANLLRQLLRVQGGEEMTDTETGEVEDYGPWKAIGQSGADYGLEREIELARLEKENEELRRMMGLIPARMKADT